MTGEQTRVAIVTGASHGIGAAVAERLALDGLAVVINYASGSERADAMVAKIATAGGTAIAFKADISDPVAVKALFDAAVKAFGGIDVLVNNAGIMHPTPIAEATDDAFDKTIAVNLKGTFNGLRDDGRIISFSSSVVGLYQPNYAIYAATKAGIEAMTHIVAKEFGFRGITVNAVAPGPDTPLFTGGKTQEQIDAIKRMNPFGRLGEPEDIARVVSFLAGPHGSWVSGQVIRSNGGVI